MRNKGLFFVVVIAVTLAATTAVAEIPQLPFNTDTPLPEVTFSGDNPMIGKWCGELTRLSRPGLRANSTLKVCLLILSINGDQANVLYAWDGFPVGIRGRSFPPRWGQTTTTVTPSKKGGAPTVVVKATIEGGTYTLRAEFKADKASSQWATTAGSGTPYEGTMEKIR